MNSEVKEQKSRIDWMITLMPLTLLIPKETERLMLITSL